MKKMKILNTKVIQFRLDNETIEKWGKVCDKYDIETQCDLFKQFVDLIEATIDDDKADDKDASVKIAYYNYTVD